MKIRSRYKGILILFLVTLFLRGILVFTARGIADDGCYYGVLAREIAHGNFREILRSIWPPLYPILTALVSKGTANIELSGRIVSCMLGSLTVFPLFFLIKKIFDKKIAIVTVLFFAVHPYLMHASAEVLTEAAYFFLVTSIAYLTWIAIEKKKSIIFLAVGFLLFILFLTRYEGILLPALIICWIWLSDAGGTTRNIRWKLVSSVLCLVVFIAAFVPYLFLVRNETGKWQFCPRQSQHFGFFFSS